MSESPPYPSTWSSALIGEVCELATGGTPQSTQKAYYQGGTIKWLVSGDVHRREILDCEGRITEEGLQNSNAKPLPIDSVIIALNGQGKTRGTVAMLRTEATCNQSLVSINPRGRTKLIPEFLFWNLRGRYEEIRRMTGDDGNERRGLNMPLIRGIRVPIPPIDEQKRIVAKLDQAFVVLERAHANAEESLRDAEELLNSQLRRLLTESRWPTKPLSDVCTEVFAGGDVPNGRHSKELSEEYKVPIFTNGEKNDGLYGYTDTPRVTSPSLTISARGTIGYAVMRREPFFPAIRLIVVVPDVSVLDLTYLYYAVRAIDIDHTGASIPQLTVPMTREFEIPMPPLEVQRDISARLDKLQSQVSQLRSTYNSGISDIVALRQSLLQAAFSGQLT